MLHHGIELSSTARLKEKFLEQKSIKMIQYPIYPSPLPMCDNFGYFCIKRCSHRVTSKDKDDEVIKAYFSPSTRNWCFEHLTFGKFTYIDIGLISTLILEKTTLKLLGFGNFNLTTLSCMNYFSVNLLQQWMGILRNIHYVFSVKPLNLVEKN